MDLNRIAKQNDNAPLCQLGPGGEYTYLVEEKEVIDNSPVANPLGRLLATLADVIGATIQPELIKNMLQPAGQCSIDSIQEKLYAQSQNHRQSDPKAVAGTASRCGISIQPLLFSDDGRNRRTAKRKTTNRVRAYRGASTKAAAGQFQRQGSLFAVNGAC